MSARLLATILLASAFAVFSSATSDQRPTRPHITGLANIAIYTHDFEKSRAFYRDFLGFAEPYSLSNPDGSLSMTFFKINERQYIELSPEKEAGSDRLRHISFETDDIEALRTYLGSQGVKVPAATSRGRIGNRSFNITDPAGHTVEMVQYMPDGWTVREHGKSLTDGHISQRMMHAGIIVTNLNAEYKFYTEILGFKETWRGSKSGTELSWVNLKLPDSDDYVEFMLYKDQPAPTQRGGAHHLCLQVPDIEASVATLKGRLAELYGRPIEIRLGVNRKRQANLFDPDGTRTELMESGTIDGKVTPSSSAPPPSY
jgi:catechol 2,3-dioxygenase-like lactoylglutathione lyase family enzyme